MLWRNLPMTDIRFFMNIVTENFNINNIDEIIEDVIYSYMNNISRYNEDFYSIQEMFIEYLIDTKTLDQDDEKDAMELDQINNSEPSELLETHHNFRVFVYNYLYDLAHKVCETISNRFNAGSINIWRMITVPLNWNPENRPLGEYWSWDKNAADAHWGHNSGDVLTVLISGKVQLENINWESTITANIKMNVGDDEREITVIDQAPITILDIAVVAKSEHIDHQNIPSYAHLIGQQLPA